MDWQERFAELEVLLQIGVVAKADKKDLEQWQLLSLALEGMSRNLARIHAQFCPRHEYVSLEGTYSEAKE